MKRGDKLYVVTRRDIAPGYQAVQSIHAAQQFAVEHPSLYESWRETSNYLGLLSVKDEIALKRLASQAAHKGLAVSLYCEPDVEWGFTAITIEAGNRSRKLCNRLPLALIEYTPL
jgi:hypothetical protein